jgi:mannose-6-phosphate isomerase-like protein (cupin superfamily)/CDGSH-type Zn-finger protein
LNAQPKPTIAQLKPRLVAVEAGRTYFWCACGRSARQPFCDGSHKGTAFEPRKFIAPQNEELLFCGCKHTATPPFCDGTHSNLPGGSPLDDPESPENRAVPLTTARTGARTMLNGACYVFSPSLATLQSRGSLEYCDVISSELGAVYQGQVFMRVSGSAAPVVTFADCHSILFVSSGSGSVIISGRRFEIATTDGVYIRPNESFQLEPAVGSTLDVFASACPVGRLHWDATMPQTFDHNFPDRVVSVDAAQRRAMGLRYFQVLVDKRVGSDVITQFIGHIPQSKAAPHRHLYEESIIVLAGEGCMWTEDRKAEVRAGDVIFLPRKQVHSLEATTPAGLDVVGVIYPGDNPSINY